MAELQANLYPENEFYKNSRVVGGVAIDAEYVEIPQAGARPNVVKNPEERPLKTRIRKDDKKGFEVDLYETEPDLVTKRNQDLVTYDKVKGVQDDHINTLNQRIADELVIKWCPTVAPNIIYTTGGTTGIMLPAFTGSRKLYLKSDFVALRALLDRMGIPDDGRRCIYFYGDILTVEVGLIAEYNDYDKTGVVGNRLKGGAIGMIENMNVYKRNVPLVVNSSGIVKPYGSAIQATDKLAVLAWHPDMVWRAEGTPEIYMDSSIVPGVGGKRYNAAVRGGGMIGRNDQAGVALLVQG